MPVDNLGRQHAYDTIADRDKADPYESEAVEPARLDELDKQQKPNFHDSTQNRVTTNLQNNFIASSRMVHRQVSPN